MTIYNTDKNQTIMVAKANNQVLEQGIRVGKKLVDALKDYDNKCMTARVTNLIKKNQDIDISIDYKYNDDMILSHYVNNRSVSYKNNNGDFRSVYASFSSVEFDIEVDEDNRLNYEVTKTKILDNIDSLENRIVDIEKLENDYIELEKERDEMLKKIDEFNNKVSKARLNNSHRINIRY